MIDTMRRMYKDVLLSKRSIEYVPNHIIAFRNLPVKQTADEYIFNNCECQSHMKVSAGKKSHILLCLAINVTEYMPHKEKWK